MIIIDPVTLGDTACTRSSTATYYDRNGLLQTAPPNTLRVTYDPADLSKAPSALVEASSTNLSSYSSDLLNSGWVKENSGTGTAATITPNGGVAPDGTNTATRVQFNRGGGDAVSDYSLLYGAHPTVAGTKYAQSIFLKSNTGRDQNVVIFGSDGAYKVITVTTVWQRFYVTLVANTTTAYMEFGSRGVWGGDSSLDILAWGFQPEPGAIPTSYIPTAGAPATRAADSVGSGAGMLYSNVPITETKYQVGDTYASGSEVYDPATYQMYRSLVAGNVGNALTDATKWAKLEGVFVGRWKMLDQYNNTQTTNADEILLVVSPRALAQGIYLGNLDANEVRVSVTDLTDGVVYRETRSLVVPNSGSSFFNWCFRRIKRNDYFVTTSLPPYANALITISIRKDGGTAKCGMCAVGPIDDFGPSLYGLSTEGKDYSSTTFNFDGTSSTVIRPYAKRMTVDVQVENDQIDYVQGRLFEYRQKPIVWIGGPYGSTAVFGRYGSFKNVIEYQTLSKMALTIEGSV